MILTVVGALLMVVAVVLVVTRGLMTFRGVRRGPPGADLRVLSRTTLAPKQGVAVVEAGGDRLVVSFGEGGVRMLHNLGPQEGAGASREPESPQRTFNRTGLGSGLTRAGVRIARRGVAGLWLAVVVFGGGPLAAQDTAIPPPANAAQAAQTAPVEPDAALSAAEPAGPPGAEAEPLGPDVLWDLMKAAGVSGSGDEGLLPGPVGAVLFVGFLTLLPTLLLLMTSFTRILVVLNLLRQAVGTQTAPPTHLLIALSLLLTGFVMSPTLQDVNEVALRPWVDGEIDEVQMLTAGSEPFRRFMVSQVREQDLAVFAEMQSPPPATLEEVSLPVLTSAFVTSELRRAFQIGFALFLPFVVIDVVVASVLMSMGMFMLPPVMVSLPFKLLLFVMVDGWALMLGGLVRSFGT